MIRHFDIDVYERTLFVVTGATKEQMNKQFVTCIDPAEDGLNGDAFSFKAGNPIKGNSDVYVVYFRDDSAKTAGTQAHEAVHVADMIYSDLGIFSDTRNNEPLAYLIGYITNCINRTRK